MNTHGHRKRQAENTEKGRAKGGILMGIRKGINGKILETKSSDIAAVDLTIQGEKCRMIAIYNNEGVKAIREEMEKQKNFRKPIHLCGLWEFHSDRLHVCGQRNLGRASKFQSRRKHGIRSYATGGRK